METTLPVREAAKRTNTSIHTLRYYERIGLINTARAANGHRQYFEHDLGWIRVLTCLRATGMPIQGMLHFAQIVSEGEHTVPARQEFLEHHRDQVRAQIAELEQNLVVVEAKIQAYKNSR